MTAISVVGRRVIDPVNRGYAALIERIPRLQAAGVNVFDATLIFRDINQGIYADDCCHYTDAGYDLLFKMVAQEIARLIDGGVASTSGVVRASKPLACCGPAFDR